MTYERYVKRTIWIWTCPKCGDWKEAVSHPPRERQCSTCKVWAPYVEESYVGPDMPPATP
jgi:hypothetical protein